MLFITKGCLAFIFAYQEVFRFCIHSVWSCQRRRCYFLHEELEGDPGMDHVAVRIGMLPVVSLGGGEEGVWRRSSPSCAETSLQLA